MNPAKISFFRLLGLLLIACLVGTVHAQTQTPEDIALERIQAALAEGTTELDLSDMDLTTLPPEIGQLTNLTWLDLSENQLPALPPEIGQLTNLTHLNLSGNPLTDPLPDVIDGGVAAILAYYRNQGD